ncbi:MAG: rod shape-determining protein MreC [Terracidiphilus sp.]|nr:rod shape-determining protein MreC [Terracidiphilus sp.]
MESFVVRYRNLLVLLALLLAQIVGLAVQVRRTDSGRTTLDAGDSSSVRLIRLWANGLVSPPERLIQGAGGGIASLWQSYVSLRHVRSENLALQETIDRLRLEQAALLEDARQGQRLQGMLGFQEKYIYKTQIAQVIGTSGSDRSHVVVIDKGHDAGLEHDMAVISADGIVGKVREVFPHSAQILLVNDQSSGAGVILESTRVRGILRGNAAGQPQIVGIISDNRIQPGERVLTAGGDEIFPRGLTVGVVQKVERDPDQDGFIRVIVKPAAHLDRLDEVMVITSTQPRFPPEQTADMITSDQEKSGDLLQQQAQKKATEIMGERLPGLLDPNLPADQQPLNDNSNPNSVTHPQMPLRPDRFTPGDTGNSSGTAPAVQPQPSAQKKPAAPRTTTQPNTNATPRRNP